MNGAYVPNDLAYPVFVNIMGLCLKVSCLFRITSDMVCGNNVNIHV